MEGAFDRSAFDNSQGTGGYFTGLLEESGQGGIGGGMGWWGSSPHKHRKHKRKDWRKEVSDAIDAAFEKIEAKAEAARETTVQSLDAEPSTVKAAAEYAYETTFLDELNAAVAYWQARESEVAQALRAELEDAERAAFETKRRFEAEDDEDIAAAMMVIFAVIRSNA
jgi:hypothetical protein